ncbi:MAG: SHOCT domain-containing protein [Clostridium sp.]|nr:SHOCT domain-containing protein [Clostridium sp.]
MEINAGILFSIINLIYIIIIICLGLFTPINKKSPKQEKFYDDVKHYYNIWWIFLIIVTGLLYGIVVIRKMRKQKIVRKYIQEKVEDYMSKKGYEIEKGNAYSRVYKIKNKDIICIYLNGKIIELNFDNIVKFQTYENSELQVYGNYYNVSSSTVLDKIELKIYTNLSTVENSIISLEYKRRYIDNKYINEYLVKYVKEAESILNYAKIHSDSSKEEKQKTYEEIREYKKLLDEGIITQAEFENKKKKLLND